MSQSMGSYLPNEILLHIFEQVDDLQTVSRLARSFPDLLGTVLENRFHDLIPSLFPTSWTTELREYAYAAVLAEIRGWVDPRDLLLDLLEEVSPETLLIGLPPTVEIVHKLACVTDAVEFFTVFCSTLFLSNFPSNRKTLLSQGEAFRIRRALLRFQLYTQFFHQPRATDVLVSDRDWEARPRSEEYFWTRFTSVEAEECKCVYVLLVNALTRTRPIQHLNDPSFPSQVSRQRGLPLLQPVFCGAPKDISPLAASYAERLVDYAGTGLEKVDPHDANYFLPYYDFQHQDLVKQPRYQPSEAQRERNFGFEVGRRPGNKYSGGMAKDRSLHRMIGYCFWDEERVDFSLGEVMRIACSKW